MSSSKNKDGPSTGPQADRWYKLSLGSSFKDDHPSSKFCTLRYEFKPASIDKNQPGTLHKSKDNKVTVEFNNNQVGKSKVVFEGSSEDYKENDAVLFFDGESFRLERLHRAVKRMRHLRVPGESAVSTTAAASVGPAADPASPPPLPKAPKVQAVQPISRTTIPAAPIEEEKVEIGDMNSPDEKTENDKVAENPFEYSNSANEYSEFKNEDLEEELDILNDDDDDDGGAAVNGTNIDINEFDTGIDINIPQRHESDDEIADVDVSDGEADNCVNAAEALRAQVNAEGEEQSSSDSSSSESDSSGSGSGSPSGSGSGSGSGSDSESSDADSVE